MGAPLRTPQVDRGGRGRGGRGRGACCRPGRRWGGSGSQQGPGPGRLLCVLLLSCYLCLAMAGQPLVFHQGRVVVRAWSGARCGQVRPGKSEVGGWGGGLTLTLSLHRLPTRTRLQRDPAAPTQAPLLGSAAALTHGLPDKARRQLAWWLGGTAAWVSGWGGGAGGGATPHGKGPPASSQPSSRNRPATPTPAAPRPRSAFTNHHPTTPKPPPNRCHPPGVLDGRDRRPDAAHALRPVHD